jgi:hypothetical protein
MNYAGFGASPPPPQPSSGPKEPSKIPPKVALISPNAVHKSFISICRVRDTKPKCSLPFNKTLRLPASSDAWKLVHSPFYNQTWSPGPKVLLNSVIVKNLYFLFTPILLQQIHSKCRTLWSGIHANWILQNFLQILKLTLRHGVTAFTPVTVSRKTKRPVKHGGGAEHRNLYRKPYI